MYTTKLLHKNKMKDPSYITIGDVYQDQKANPFRQPGKKEEKLTPFITNAQPKNTDNGFFSKLTYPANNKYTEMNTYIDKQPLDTRKTGFGSKDAFKRDEFTNYIRTEQYRETVRKEQHFLKPSGDLEEELNRLMQTSSSSTSFGATSPTSTGTLYDTRVSGYDIGRTRVTEFDPKSAKDTFYKFGTTGGLKRLGTHRPASSEFGENLNDFPYKPPTYGGKSEVKNFFDKSHLSQHSF